MLDHDGNAIPESRNVTAHFSYGLGKVPERGSLLELEPGIPRDYDARPKIRRLISMNAGSVLYFWPVFSLDLNPIETVWDWMKGYIVSGWKFERTAACKRADSHQQPHNYHSNGGELCSRELKVR
jgi:hypothetical protein